METIFHGHSFVELRFDGKRILIDPFVEGNSSCDLTVHDLLQVPLDAIIVTHGHDDHV
jgi:L-ascorbate metabolism protein UlaG (beta-lactamase superfamily)